MVRSPSPVASRKAASTSENLRSWVKSSYPRSQRRKNNFPSCVDSSPPCSCFPVSPPQPALTTPIRKSKGTACPIHLSFSCCQIPSQESSIGDVVHCGNNRPRGRQLSPPTRARRAGSRRQCESNHGHRLKMSVGKGFYKLRKQTVEPVLALSKRSSASDPSVCAATKNFPSSGCWSAQAIVSFKRVFALKKQALAA